MVPRWTGRVTFGQRLVAGFWKVSVHDNGVCTPASCVLGWERCHLPVACCTRCDSSSKGRNVPSWSLPGCSRSLLLHLVPSQRDACCPWRSSISADTPRQLTRHQHCTQSRRNGASAGTQRRVCGQVVDDQKLGISIIVVSSETYSSINNACSHPAGQSNSRNHASCQSLQSRLLTPRCNNGKANKASRQTLPSVPVRSSNSVDLRLAEQTLHVLHLLVAIGVRDLDEGL